MPPYIELCKEVGIGEIRTDCRNGQTGKRTKLKSRGGNPVSVGPIPEKMSKQDSDNGSVVVVQT